MLENARRKAQNEITKTRIDLETKALQERLDTIGKLMGDVLEDLTKASLDKIEKYVKPEAEEPEGAPEGAPVPAPRPVRTLEEARQRGDWLFIFEAARATHLDIGAEDDLVLRFEKRKQEEDYLSKLKHVSGDFNRWITRFEDQVKVCETIGVVLTEEAKVFYFMNNLNDTIFGTVKANFMELSTRVRVMEKNRLRKKTRLCTHMHYHFAHRIFLVQYVGTVLIVRTTIIFLMNFKKNNYL